MAFEVPVLMRGFADKLFVGTGSTRGDLPPVRNWTEIWGNLTDILRYFGFDGYFRQEVPPYSPSTTYVYLMAMRNLTPLVERMLELGFPAETAAAIVQNGTVPSQKTLRTTIGSMVADVEAAGLSSPAVITVGAVAKALDGSLGWDEYLAQFPPIKKE